jgi:hypothetical protein
MRQVRIVSVIWLVLVGCMTNPRSLPAKETTIESIVQTSQSPGEAFDLSMQWMKAAFVSTQNVIQYCNRSAGMITSTANIQLPRPKELIYLDYSLTIALKDGFARLTYTATNARLMLNGSPQVQPVAEEQMEAMRQKAAALTADYTDYLRTHLQAL